MVAMVPSSENSPQAFFRDLRQAFGHTLQGPLTAAGIDAALQQAWDSFDGNVAIQCEGQPPIACKKGCPSCCTLRVGVLAPEVFMVATFLRATAKTLQAHGIDLIARVREADVATRGLDDVARVRLKRRCAYIEQGVCLIHRVRPLACRGHASYDRQACIEAAAGRLDEVPFSEPHQVVRTLVQTALQASLRARDLAWSTYELNHALVLALDDASASHHWLAGGDPLAAAAIDQDQRADMAVWFDEVERLD